jgi:hypothetical protein
VATPLNDNIPKRQRDKSLPRVGPSKKKGPKIITKIPPPPQHMIDKALVDLKQEQKKVAIFQKIENARSLASKKEGQGKQAESKKGKEKQAKKEAKQASKQTTI